MTHHAAAQPSVLLVDGHACFAGGPDLARSDLLYRALCQLGRVTRAHGSADAAGQAAMAKTAPDIVVLTGGAVLPQGLGTTAARVVAVPDVYGALPDDLPELWVIGDQPVPGSTRPRVVHRIAGAVSSAGTGAGSGAGTGAQPGNAALIWRGDGVPDIPPLPAALNGARILVPADQANAPDTVRSLIEAGHTATLSDLRTALARSEHLVLLDQGAQDMALGPWAAATGRVLHPSDPMSANIDIVPDRSVVDVATALGCAVPDATTRGARLAENLGLRTTLVEAKLNPMTRVVSMIYDLDGDIDGGTLGGTHAVSNATGTVPDSGLVNPMVEVIAAPPGTAARIRAAVRIGPDIVPRDLCVTLDIRGLRVTRLTPPDFQTEAAGLLTAEPAADGDQTTITYWSLDPDTALQQGILQVPPTDRQPTTPLQHPDRPAPMVLRANMRIDPDGGPLHAAPRDGLSHPLYDLGALDAPLRASSAILAQMRDAYAGRTAWLIGNGPSVQPADLDRLHDAGALCFCFNRFHLAHDRTRLRPDFTVTGDDQMIADFGQEIIDRSAGHVMVASTSPPPLAGAYSWLRLLPVFPALFSQDAHRCVTPGGSSVYIALQLGWFLGLRRFHLYGADFRFHFAPSPTTTDPARAATGEGNHFIPGYRSDRAWCPPSIDNILSSFIAARLLLERDGGTLLNVSHGGALDVLERMPFDDALARDVAARTRSAAPSAATSSRPAPRAQADPTPAAGTQPAARPVAPRLRAKSPRGTT